MSVRTRAEAERSGCWADLVDEEQLRVVLRLVEDVPAVWAGLHVAGEDRSVDLLVEGELAAELKELRMGILPPWRLEWMDARLAAGGGRGEEGEVGPGDVVREGVGCR